MVTNPIHLNVGLLVFHIPKNPHSDGLDELPMLGDEIDDKELKKRLAHDDNHNPKKRKLEAKAAKLIHENGYHPDRSDVLTRHMKQHSNKNEKSKINKEELRKHLIKVEHEYQEKLGLGKDIYEMLDEGVVSYQALTRDLKEAVDLYIENQADFRDVGNVELKPWQNELMKYIEPHEREIIWVGSKNMLNLHLEHKEW